MSHSKMGEKTPPAATGSAKLCFKCKKSIAFTPSRDGIKKPYCVECFCVYVEKLVRDAFFRQCALQPDTTIGICCSGGFSSTTLLRIATKFRKENLERGGTGKKNFKLVVLHLDESTLVVSSPPQPNLFKQLYEIVDAEATRGPFTTDSSSTATADDERLKLPVLTGRAVDMLPPSTVAAINGKGTLTDREELYAQSRSRCLADLAVNAGCDVVLFGDNGVQCAVKALAAVSRGRGSQLPTETGFVGMFTSSDGAQVRTARPIRSVLSKEVALYCRAQAVAGHYTPSPATGTSLRSLNRALESFVNRMLVNFKSSAFNVLHAVDKMDTLRPPQETEGQQGDSGDAPVSTVNCLGCGLPCEEATTGVNSSSSCSSSNQGLSEAASSLPLCYACSGVQARLPPDDRDGFFLISAISRRASAGGGGEEGGGGRKSSSTKGKGNSSSSSSKVDPRIAQYILEDEEE